MNLASRLAVIAVLLAAVAGCSRAVGTSPPPDEIRIAIPSDIRGTNPGVDRDAITDAVLAHVVEGLVAYDENFHVAPMLADTYEVSSDGTRYTFHLRTGIKFQNGARVTSREVKWSWERLLDPKTRFLCRDWYDGTHGIKISAIDTPDSLTVVFHLANPNYLLLEQMANFQCLGAVLHPDSVNASGHWIKPIGTGPYEIAQWRRGQFVLLKRFDGYRPRPEPRSGYAGAKQALAKYIRWDVIPDAAAARAALYSGQIDIVTGLQPSDLGELASEPSVRILQSPSIEWLALLLNTDDPILKNKLVREAIAHAIDYRALAKGATFGRARANPSVISRASPYHDEVDEQGYTYDPEASRRLLREAGYRGEPILLQANKRYPAMFDNAIIVQSMLRKVGLNVRLEVLEWATQLANVPARRFQLMSFGFSGRPYPLFAFQSVLGVMHENPWMQWQNGEALKLAERASVLPEAANRSKLFDDMHRLMLADVPMINLYGATVIDAVSDRISGYDAWPAAKPRLWGVDIRAPNGRLQ